MSNIDLATQAKTRGNAHFAKQEWDKAIEEYSEAIKHDPSGPNSHTYYSNRSASYAGKDDYEDALKDAEECLKLQPSFSKGYSRKALALYKLEQYDEAEKCYEEGLKIDPNNESLKEGLQQTKEAKESPPLGGGGGGKGLFGPEIWMAIHNDPELRGYANDKDFVAKINMLQKNPQMAMQHGVLSDPKISKVFEKMLGVKLGQAGPNDFGDQNEDADMKDDHSSHDHSSHDHSSHDHSHNHDHSDHHGHSHNHNHDHKKKEKTPEPEPVKEEETKEEKEARIEKQRKQKEAIEHKENGNKLYSEKKYDEAIAEYEKAHELDPTKPAYILNQSAVLFSQEKWDECILKCEKALEICRANFSELQWSYKAYLRMGGVEEKRNNLDKAIIYYKKALVEQKDDKLKKRVKTLEQLKVKQQEQSYHDPEKAALHKEKGNDYYKNAKWQDAITEYTESIKRNPKDARVYSNRANAFCKLMAWEPALKDCDEAIKVDKTFIKPLIRKGKIYQALKQYHKSLDCYRKAAKIEPNNEDLMQSKQELMMAIQTRNSSGEIDEKARQRALEDPEVQSAMNDAEVSSVLNQARSGDPTILFKAMRDRPHLAEKIETLMAAGVLQVQ